MNKGQAELTGHLRTPPHFHGTEQDEPSLFNICSEFGRMITMQTLY